MKKTLLSAIAVAMSALSTLANVTTISFDGKGDLYGLTRQTFATERALNDAVTAGTADLVPELSLTDEGINFTIKKTSETGVGYALIEAGNYSGLCSYAPMYGNPLSSEVTLTVPGGKISGIKLYMTGYAVHNLTISFNGREVDPESENTSYYWTWSDEEGTESVVFSFTNTYGCRYIKSIEVTYSEDLGGKEECGLAFSEPAAQGIIGEEFTAPVLANPNNLALTWASSDENVATVSAEGVVTLVRGGKTTISVATEGNETYAKGNAKYELTVIGCANNITELIEMAPNRFDLVKVNFPVTVTFANGSYAFVIDEEDNAGYIMKTPNPNSQSTAAVTVYKIGQVLPAGWIATNDTQFGEETWQGVPETATETVEVVYPKVDAVTPADVFRVVILKNVTFTTRTPVATTKAYGTTPDGTLYEFQNTYEVPQKNPGTYDVTVVVRFATVGSKQYFYLAPLAYTESDKTGVSEIEAVSADARYYNLQGVEIAKPEGGVYIVRRGDKVTKELLK